MNCSIIPGVTAFSSMEVAKLTGKRHDHVLRDIETTLETGGIPTAEMKVSITLRVTTRGVGFMLEGKEAA